MVDPTRPDDGPSGVERRSGRERRSGIDRRTGRRAVGAPPDDEFRLVAPSGVKVIHPERVDARRRAKAMLPSAFTIGNMLLGFTSIHFAQTQRLRPAAVLIAVAILFDIFDGAVARAVGAMTPFGLQLDSLADLISFGVAPAILLYSWGLHGLDELGWAIAGYWLACAAFRLARFNVTIDPAGDKKYFIGLASPGAAGVVIASVFAFKGDPQGWDQGWAVLVAAVPATLMVSPFRFTSFRFIASPNPDRRWVTVAVVLLLGLGLATIPAATGCVVAYGYVLVAPIGWITRPLRLRWFGPDAVAPPRRKVPSVFFLTEDEVGRGT